jgi:hypothetical protein
MISFAQNFEDVILERLFKDKKTASMSTLGHTTLSTTQSHITSI